jgi:hypothetical protein
MSCYVGAHPFRCAERLMVFSGNVIADAQCHELSSWVDSPLVAFNQHLELSAQGLHGAREARREASLSQHEAQT